MTIVSSIIAKDVEKSGRRWIREDHTDHLGMIYEFWYRVKLPDYDILAALAARAVTLAADLAKAEVLENIAAVQASGSLAAPTFIHSTVTQNASALRTAYQTATRIEAVMTGYYLASLTDGQLRTAFGMTAAQVTTLRTNKLTPAANLATSIRAATGA